MLNIQTARKLLSILALTSCFIAVIPVAVRADSLPGFTLFSGVEPSNQLSYRLDSGNRNSTDRYRLKIPGSKINRLGAAQIQISYPDYYKGKFDDKGVEVFVGDKSIPVKSVEWDRERQVLQIDLAKQLKTKGEIEVVLNNVQNPDGGGMYYFTCQVKSSAEFPLSRYVGTWILSID
ncbi:DUF2808 domain-containing protein [Chamaesiphon sp. VAR_48_metabat_135_sub]|uniref:DUF2808 domain-containing protein n=1 Tax=Chamaesiphon sp. VAR_48_metabat_135_sub TaxID=2964699 RepID=UPI00286CA632|nr:DUF2808 domain-containing protein [Chamaesiphon sp. VAR_48_metabat_135_sub]